MIVEYSARAMDDLEFWRTSGNKAIQRKILDLVESIRQTPYEGIGQPEALKHNLSGLWSRRINQENRLVYQVNELKIEILVLKGHYESF